MINYPQRLTEMNASPHLINSQNYFGALEILRTRKAYPTLHFILGYDE